MVLWFAVRQYRQTVAPRYVREDTPERNEERELEGGEGNAGNHLSEHERGVE